MKPIGLPKISRLTAVVFAAWVATIAAVGGVSAAERTSIGAAARRPGTAMDTRTLAGTDRRYWLYVSPIQRAGDGARPLVIVMHGNGGSAAQLMGENGERAPLRRWLDIADREGWSIVAPDGTMSETARPTRGWNDCRGDNEGNPAVDDVAFLERLIDDVARVASVDRRRVFAVGHSNGGNMALRLAIERPRLVAAVAAIAAAMPAKSECVAPSAFVPVVFISGTDDPIMPYAGGMVGFGGMNRGSVLSTPDSAGVWVSLGKLPSAPNSLQLPNLDRRDRTRVTRLTYRQADGRPGVVLYRVEGGDHGIPSRLPRTDGESPARWLARAGGRPNGDIESADEIAAFFAAVSR